MTGDIQKDFTFIQYTSHFHEIEMYTVTNENVIRLKPKAHFFVIMEPVFN